MNTKQSVIRPVAVGSIGAFFSARRSFAGRVRLPQFAVLGLAAACTLFNTGCVVGRRTVALPVPTIGSAGAAKGEMFVGTVTDARQFENTPASPSTPSIDGDATKLTVEERAVFIGRQRNGFGKAMGDIALPANDSVVQRARLLLEEGLRRRGYQVSKDQAAANSAEVVIDEFWAWFTPGMWSVTFEAKVTCTITIKKADTVTKLTINGYGSNQGQMASDENWQLAYNRAFTDFLLKLDPELAKAGL